MAMRKRSRINLSLQDSPQEEAAYQDALRKVEALSLQDVDRPITKVPRRRPGTHGLSERQTDQEHTCFTLDEAEEEGLKDLELCNLLDGRGPPNFDQGSFSAYNVENLRGVLRLGWRELNYVIMDSLYQSIEEAQELGIDVNEDDLEVLRDRVFLEEGEKKYMAKMGIITEQDAIKLIKRLRCELAWTKDNRDWLVEYVDMAQELNENETPHKLKFQFAARNAEIELMENRERERMLCGNIEDSSAEDEADGPLKRRRGQILLGESNHDKADEGVTLESDSSDDESSGDEDMDSDS